MAARRRILRQGQRVQRLPHRRGNGVGQQFDDGCGAPLQPEPEHGGDHLLQLLAILLAQARRGGDRQQRPQIVEPKQPFELNQNTRARHRIGRQQRIGDAQQRRQRRKGGEKRLAQALAPGQVAAERPPPSRSARAPGRRAGPPAPRRPRAAGPWCAPNLVPAARALAAARRRARARARYSAHRPATRSGWPADSRALTRQPQVAAARPAAHRRASRGTMSLSSNRRLRSSLAASSRPRVTAPERSGCGSGRSRKPSASAPRCTTARAARTGAPTRRPVCRRARTYPGLVWRNTRVASATASLTGKACNASSACRCIRWRSARR